MSIFLNELFILDAPTIYYFLAAFANDWDNFGKLKTMMDDPLTNEFDSESVQKRQFEKVPRSIADTLVIYDEEEECPYLSGKTARMPLQFPLTPIQKGQTEDLLASGFRRSGKFLYQATCPECNSCEAIRVEVNRFAPNRSQKRALRKGNTVFDIEYGDVKCTNDHIRIFNKHRDTRGLNRHGGFVDEQDYRMFLVESCLDSFEITYYFQTEFVGAAICDLGENSMSAVYTFFDPDYARYSPGTYSIMKQLEWCREQDLKFLYLGYFVSGSPHMNYKQNFKPHQRLQNGKWLDFQNPEPSF